MIKYNLELECSEQVELTLGQTLSQLPEGVPYLQRCFVLVEGSGGETHSKGFCVLKVE